MSGQDLGDLTTQQLLDDISQTLSDEQLAPPRTTVRPMLRPDSLSSKPLTSTEHEVFRDQIGRCWVVDVGKESAMVTVTVEFEMTKQGKVIAPTVKMIGYAGGNLANAELAFQAARRAVLRCQKGGYKLPIEKYERWRKVSVTFDPRHLRKN